ncbi:MAG: signal peptidase I, partial [Limisphaera sp.]|nr:signal peptidase I [Limisphaera sp.]
MTVGATLAVLRFRFMLAVVQGESMLPTLAPDDLLVIDTRAYVRSAPQRGDLVIARWGDELLVKRIVGLPGEMVELRAGRVWINDRPLQETHPLLEGNLRLGKGRLRPNHYALLGDNRTVSDLLPLHAVVPRERILGKVVAVIPLRPRAAPTGTPCAGRVMATPVGASRSASTWAVAWPSTVAGRARITSSTPPSA